MSTSKTVIFIRHAHRDTEEHSRDNGLSDKGREQVKKMIKFAKERLNGFDPIFFSSPKKRCQETIGPLAKEFKQTVIVDQRITEHGMAETAQQYSARIDDFLSFCSRECPDVTVICSHGDWIPAAVKKLTGATIDLKKSGWCEVERMGDAYALTWIVQKYF